VAQTRQRQCVQMLGMTFDIQTHLALLAVSGTRSLSGLSTIREEINRCWDGESYWDVSPLRRT
jgi:hypothetical protein